MSPLTANSLRDVIPFSEASRPPKKMRGVATSDSVRQAILESDLSISRAAKKYAVSESTVRRIRRGQQRRTSPLRYSDNVKRKVLASKLSVRDAAKKYGVSASTVKRWRREARQD
jgi:transposase-like protein